MTRDEVADLVLGARTLDECAAAEQALRRWIERHPDDVAMQEIGEGLAMMQEALTAPDEGVDPARDGGSADHLEQRPLEAASDADFGLSFDEEVRLTQAELGWSEEEARAFVLSYRRGPTAQRVQMDG